MKVTDSLKSIRIWSYSGPQFPAFGLNTERYGVFPRIQSEWEKMRTRITLNTDIFHKVRGKGSRKNIFKNSNLFNKSQDLHKYLRFRALK